MLEEIFDEFGDQIFGVIECLLFISIVVYVFLGGPIGTLISNITSGIC